MPFIVLPEDKFPIQIEMGIGNKWNMLAKYLHMRNKCVYLFTKDLDNLVYWAGLSARQACLKWLTRNQDIILNKKQKIIVQEMIIKSQSLISDFLESLKLGDWQ
jgi:hypothetical protein